MTALMNFEIVTAENGQPVTTSLAIAQGLDLPHASVIKLVRRYKSDFEEFGSIAFEISNSGFEISNSIRSSRGRHTECAILNEQQATLLLTYMRNSPKVRQFKKALVKAFFEARALINHDCTSLIREHAALCNAFATEQDHASYHGKGLNAWKGKRDGLQAAIAKVESQLQPLLTGLSE